jgi:hypothetical protein
VDEFDVADLVSQAPAIERKLAGLTASEKLEWLARHGKIVRVEGSFPGVHRFESRLGISCGFFIKGDKFVFLGDNTTFTRDD